MSRIPRLKFEQDDAWYHLYSRIAAHKGEYPLSERAPMRRLLQIIEHYSQIYFCEVAAFCVMGNHYHLVVKFGRLLTYIFDQAKSSALRSEVNPGVE